MSAGFMLRSWASPAFNRRGSPVWRACMPLTRRPRRGAISGRASLPLAQMRLSSSTMIATFPSAALWRCCRWLSAMSPSDLCQLPPEPVDGWREVQPAYPAVPLPINNPPGLSSLSYRIGTFTSFRRAMLDRIAAASLIVTSPPTPTPFLNWREGADSDYHTVFIELWAYL